ncbi:hypothetical protein B566_EDAN014649 [Ephemera danica]|nr:hypothetical protein B566_EDAN014649 [Ephemera danica]
MQFGCPGRKDLRLLTNEMQYTMLGAVYWGGASTSHRDNPAYKYLPLDNKDRLTSTYLTTSGNYVRYPVYLFGEAGFSVHFPNIATKQKQLMLGAPGAYNWAGSAILYEDDDFDMGRARRRRSIGPGAFASAPVIIDGFRNSLESFGLFGYAVTSGRFFSRRDVFYVGGAPRTESNGRVYLFKFPRDGDKSMMTNKITLSGTQPGEYFGGSLATCDVNGDNLDDLLVGAPLFTYTEQDEGRVLLYLGNQQQSLVKRSTIYVAIGAPFEDKGVVYLYRGASGGLSTVTTRIAASEYFPNLSGFGFSISRGQDVDGNRYADVAVGAYRSGHAVLLRSRPVVQFKVELRTAPQRLRRDAEYVELEICVKYFGNALPPHLRK